MGDERKKRGNPPAKADGSDRLILRRAQNTPADHQPEKRIKQRGLLRASRPVLHALLIFSNYTKPEFTTAEKTSDRLSTVAPLLNIL